MWHGGLLGKIARDSYFMWLATKTFIENQKNTDKKNVKGSHDNFLNNLCKHVGFRFPILKIMLFLLLAISFDRKSTFA